MTTATAAAAPITWVPLISSSPGLWEGGGDGSDDAHAEPGLAAAEAAIVAAVRAAGPPESVCLVLDSLAALRDAARSPRGWRAFLASRALLACPAAAVITRVDARAADADEGTPRWLPALVSAASLVLSAAPLPSGAAAGVEGTLTLQRRSAAGVGSAAGASPLACSVFNYAASSAGGVRVEARRRA